MISGGGFFATLPLAIAIICVLSVNSSQILADAIVDHSSGDSAIENNLKRLMRREQRGKLDHKLNEDEDDGLMDAIKSYEDDGETPASPATGGNSDNAGTGQNATAQPARAPVPADPHAGKIKDGFCKNWQEGSSVRDLGEGNSYWGSQNQLTEEQCFDNCDNDKACEQAVYQANTQECWLGLNAMTEDPGPNKCNDCINTCYAKHGFGYQLSLDMKVKDGWCSGFQEGWGGALPQQCDLNAITVESQKQCSHWGAEYGLSERGCWVKCQENPTCTQAVYENKANSWACFIGTGTMTSNPGPSRCSDCNNRCYAPTGFSFDSSAGGAIHR